MSEDYALKVNDKWSPLFNSIPGVITMQDKDLHVLEANTTARRLFLTSSHFYRLQPLSSIKQAIAILGKNGVRL